MKRSHNSLNFVLQEYHMEKSTGPSLTVPDDTYSIQDLMERHANGLQDPVQYDGKYYMLGDQDDWDADDLEKIPHGDLVDRQIFAERLGEQVNTLRSRVKEYEDSMEQLRLEQQKEYDEIREEFKRRKGEGVAPTKPGGGEGGTTPTTT